MPQKTQKNAEIISIDRSPNVGWIRPPYIAIRRTLLSGDFGHAHALSSLLRFSAPSAANISCPVKNELIYRMLLLPMICTMPRSLVNREAAYTSPPWFSLRLGNQSHVLASSPALNKSGGSLVRRQSFVYQVVGRSEFYRFHRKEGARDASLLRRRPSHVSSAPKVWEAGIHQLGCASTGRRS